MGKISARRQRGAAQRKEAVSAQGAAFLRHRATEGLFQLEDGSNPIGAFIRYHNGDLCALNRRPPEAGCRKIEILIWAVLLYAGRPFSDDTLTTLCCRFVEF